MKINTTFAAIAVILVLCTSCAFHTGNVSTGVVPDCKLASIVTGYASTDLVFGIGGLNKTALIMYAKQNLYAKLKLNKDEKITNYAVDFKTTYFLPFLIKNEVILSAEVYDCSKYDTTANTNILYSNKYVESMKSQIRGFNVGDSIAYINELQIMYNI
ncbi:MAG: DUF6567 family protein [Cytophagales bacterium]|nr:DUF6567 family protein [Cytophagales bacterium]